jgi:spore germination protein KB
MRLGVNMKEIISVRQGIILLILFLLGSTVVVGIGAEAKQDIWIAILLGLVITLPVIFVYSRLLTLFPEKDLYEILEVLFGKRVGRSISVLYIWFSIHLAAMVLYNFSSFINVVGLPETPRVVPSICLMILCVYGVKLGLEVIGRWGEFFITILLIIAVIIALLSIPNFKLDNIRPVLSDGIKPVMKGAISIFSFPLSETVVFTAIFSSLQKKAPYYKVYMTGISLGILLILAISIINILVLGPYIMSLNYFTTYVTTARINIGDFIQRIEILASIAFLVSGFVKTSMCLLSAVKGMSRVFNLSDYRLMVNPVALLILNLSFFVFEDIMESQRFSATVSIYYKFLINAIVPIIILIVAEIKIRKKRV